MFEGKKLIDLTHPLDEHAPTWSGGCGFSYKNKMDYDQGLRAQSLRMLSGVGTHMDAPSHFIPDGKSIADIDLADLILPLHVIHKKCEASDQLLVSDLKTYEKEYGIIKPGAFVAFHSHWDHHWHSEKDYRNLDSEGIMRFPTISKEACEYLLERGIKGIGIDTLSPDPEPSLSKSPFPVHHMILGEGGYILENLANLSMVHGAAYMIALPIPIIEGTESPTRVIGIL